VILNEGSPVKGIKHKKKHNFKGLRGGRWPYFLNKNKKKE
jgi:hypothetical protein